jgi:transposase
MTKSIVLEVCREMKIRPADFFGNKRKGRPSTARRIAIERLKEAGFSNAGIARMVKRNYSTIQYWLHPEYRERRVGYFKQLRASRKETGASA